MTKSLTIEIIAVLWLIAGLLCTGFWHYVFIALAAENTIESIVYAWKGKR